MTRCRCGYDGDPTVFGQCRTCAPEPESVHATSVQAELDRLERPYERTLSGDGSGEALPPLLRSAYPPDSKPLPYETVLSDGDGDLG